MIGRDDSEDSFDPRHWLKGDAAVPRAAAPTSAEDPSADPYSWLAAKPPAPPAPSPPASPRPTTTRQPFDRRVPAAIGASVAILSAGALLAWSTRPAGPATPVAGGPTAQQPVDAPTSHRILMVSGPNAIADSLIAAGIAPADARQAGTEAAAALGDAPGDVRLVFDMKGSPGAATLGFLEATHNDGSGLALTRKGNGFTQDRYGAKLSVELRIIRGALDAQSFYSSAVAAGVNDSLVSDFANAFAFDFDLQREIAPGDRIEAGYEQHYNPSGAPVGLPVLVFASLTTPTKSRALYRFTESGGRAAGWYDSNGRSTVRALMRTPIDGARISSPFGMRDHPILGFMKMHKGTDFAAPVGTPIYAAGDALVEFAGLKGPNGNFVRLHHDNGWETLYLHMNRIWPGIVAGAHVTQGQQIGEVGTTGRSTGPHLHYEVHVDGQPVNPLAIDTGTGKALSGAALVSFRQQRDKVDAQRYAAAAAVATKAPPMAQSTPAAQRPSPNSH
jgi:murein DD-endopeptidase MepM/ murein hydrolase activator NlpD